MSGNNLYKIFSYNNKFLTTMITRSQVKTFSTKSLIVEHDSPKNHFAVELQGELATLDYVRSNDTITFTHTEVPDVFRGKGVGKLLAEKGLSFAKQNNLKIKIECDFVQKYYSENEAKFK